MCDASPNDKGEFETCSPGNDTDGRNDMLADDSAAMPAGQVGNTSRRASPCSLRADRPR
jgi:hypothetical protein